MPDSMEILTGTRVQVELDTTDGVECLEFIIVPDAQADFKAGFLGEGTPLAKTIIGHQAGELLAYKLGDASSVRILKVDPGIGLKPDNAARRAEKMRRVVEQANRTDAIIFASSFSGKWGDYDPGGIENWDS